MSALVGVGAVLRVSEADYLDGIGPLILRVTRVGELRQMADGQWLELEGYGLRSHSVTQAKTTTRMALVRQARPKGGA